MTHRIDSRGKSWYSNNITVLQIFEQLIHDFLCICTHTSRSYYCQYRFIKNIQRSLYKQHCWWSRYMSKPSMPTRFSLYYAINIVFVHPLDYGSDFCRRQWIIGFYLRVSEFRYCGKTVCYIGRFFVHSRVFDIIIWQSKWKISNSQQNRRNGLYTIICSNYPNISYILRKKSSHIWQILQIIYNIDALLFRSIAQPHEKAYAEPCASMEENRYCHTSRDTGNILRFQWKWFQPVISGQRGCKKRV